MSFSALDIAAAGLRATQASISVVSQNVANVGTTGYVKRSLTTVATGVGNSGVATGTITRALDAASQKQLRLETSGAAYTSTISTTRTQLDKLYGTPGDANALDGVVNGYALSLQDLAANPTSTAARSEVVSNASTLAAKVGSIANSVQTLRTSAESQLSTDTRAASGLLKSIGDLNTKVIATSDENARADLLDQRDQKITELSGYLDIQTVPQHDGSVTVTTGSGVTLVERSAAATLSFDGRGTLSPDASYSLDATKRGVGTITATTPAGAKIDLLATSAIRSGSLAAGVELRDKILPQAQRQLDDLAAGLSRAASDNVTTGVAASSGAASGFDVDLSGADPTKVALKPGNTITISLRDASGTQRNLILVPSATTPLASVDANTTIDPTATIVPIAIGGTPASIASAIQTALGTTNFTVSQPSAANPSLVRILSNGNAGDPTILSIDASVTRAADTGDVQNGTPQLPLFIDSNGKGMLFTGSFDNGAQVTGFAQRITVNPAIVKKTSTLVSYASATQSADTTRPDYLYAALTATSSTFSAGSGIGGVSAPYDSTVQGFAQSIIDAQGAGAASAKDLDEGQGIALATARSRYADTAGVNIDEELSKLVALQTAYSANARVLTAARDLLDTLLRI